MRKIILLIVGLMVLVSGCDVYETLYPQEQEVEEKHSDGIDWKFHSKGYYYDCFDEWDDSTFIDFVNGTDLDYIEGSSPFKSEIMINEDRVYFIDLDLLRNMSKQKNEEILCGKMDIEFPQYYRRKHIGEGQSFEIYSTANCNPHADDYIDYIYYKIVCCIDKYCYKHFNIWDYEDEYGKKIEYDYSFSDAKIRKCKVNMTLCEEI